MHKSVKKSVKKSRRKSRKPCKSNQIRKRSTRRCQRRPCPKSKTLDVSSRRCRRKKCSRGQIRDASTRLCRKKKSRGRKSPSKKSRSPRRKSPKQKSPSKKRRTNSIYSPKEMDFKKMKYDDWVIGMEAYRKDKKGVVSDIGKLVNKTKEDSRIHGRSFIIFEDGNMYDPDFDGVTYSIKN